MTKIYSEDQKHLISKLKQARAEAGLEQVQVAKTINKTQSYVSKIESGQIKIDVITLKIFAGLYNKNINYFINDN